MTHSENKKPATIKNKITLDVIAPGGRIGLIILATDFNSEQELRQLYPDNVEIFTNRVLNANPLTLENLRLVEKDITRAASGILPGLDLDVIIYGCTSGTIAISSEKVESLIHQSLPDIPVTNPVTAALAAFSALKAKRISILTPYIEEVNSELVSYFEKQGIEVVNIMGMGFENDIDITGIPLKAITEAARNTYDDQADLLFIACTALRAAQVINEVEQSIGLPVVTSNQALVWHSLRLKGYTESIQGFGELLENLL